MRLTVLPALAAAAAAGFLPQTAWAAAFAPLNDTIWSGTIEFIIGQAAMCDDTQARGDVSRLSRGLDARGRPAFCETNTFLLGPGNTAHIRYQMADSDAACDFSVEMYTCADDACATNCNLMATRVFSDRESLAAFTQGRCALHVQQASQQGTTSSNQQQRPDPPFPSSYAFCPEAATTSTPEPPTTSVPEPPTTSAQESPVTTSVPVGEGPTSAAPGGGTTDADSTTTAPGNPDDGYSDFTPIPPRLAVWAGNMSVSTGTYGAAGGDACPNNPTAGGGGTQGAATTIKRDPSTNQLCFVGTHPHYAGIREHTVTCNSSDHSVGDASVAVLERRVCQDTDCARCSTSPDETIHLLVTELENRYLGQCYLEDARYVRRRRVLRGRRLGPHYQRWHTTLPLTVGETNVLLGACAFTRPCAGGDCAHGGSPAGFAVGVDASTCACDCVNGWGGANCTTPLPCDGARCKNGGTPRGDQTTGCTCDCAQGWGGANCTVSTSTAATTAAADDDPRGGGQPGSGAGAGAGAGRPGFGGADSSSDAPAGGARDGGDGSDSDNGVVLGATLTVVGLVLVLLAGLMVWNQRNRAQRTPINAGDGIALGDVVVESGSGGVTSGEVELDVVAVPAAPSKPRPGPPSVDRQRRLSRLKLRTQMKVSM